MIRFEEIPRLLDPLLDGPVPEDWPTGTVSSVEQDSRRVRAEGIFACLPGTKEDGRSFLGQAVERGAKGAIGPAPTEPGIPYLCVREPRKAVAILASQHFGQPSAELEIIGVTGTNGKTTTSWLLQSISEGCGIPAAVLGTLGSGRPGALRATSHTTPDAPRFQSLLRELGDEGYRTIAAEVSSHALDQDRVHATRFRCVVFTNLTRDHLDYHRSFAAYRSAKGKLFDPDERGYDAPIPAVLNLDDEAGRWIAERTSDPVFGFGTAQNATVRLSSLSAGREGIELDLETPHGRRTIRSPLIGAYNGWNVLAAYTTALAIDLPIERVEAALAEGVTIPGRMERIEERQPFLVLVDYAHTPDALSRALQALRDLTPHRLIVLFGCGGDRDVGKRGAMGQIAAQQADRIVLTSDNPRSEEPAKILDEIAEGVRSAGREPDLVQPDREMAIRETLVAAVPGDIVLIAGKGHEDYQETADGRRPFDDREIARQCLRTRHQDG